jgi:hypothetical protein
VTTPILLTAAIFPARCKLSSCNRTDLFLIPGFKHICLQPGLPLRALAYGNSRFCILENIQNRSMSTICKLSVTSQTSFRVYGQIANITILPLTRTVGVISLSRFLQDLILLAIEFKSNLTGYRLRLNFVPGLQKHVPYPPCTVTAFWPRWRGVPGPCPDAASGNAYSLNRRAVSGNIRPGFY